MASPSGSHATNLAIQLNQVEAIEALGKCQIKKEDLTLENMELGMFGPSAITRSVTLGSRANTKSIARSEG
jgi:hypothetical protein